MTEPRSSNRFVETAIWGVEPGGVRFAAPNGLTIDVGGHVYSTDFEGGQVFSQEGKLRHVFDDVGPGPEIISLNERGEFYVSSPWADSQVRHFTQSVSCSDSSEMGSPVIMARQPGDRAFSTWPTPRMASSGRSYVLKTTEDRIHATSTNRNLERALST